MLIELGKLWGHLNDGYGLCIKQYTKLLVTKLNFHDRNPRFPGNLILGRGELEKIAVNNKLDVYFQLAIEMYDYLDDLIALSSTVFNSITTFAVSSMTAAGQCRLLALIPCIQDSNQLYDFVVRLMFLLHASLPDDLLHGHRERFRTLFRQINSFYKQAGQLQYINSLISVPSLGKNPPNFLVQSDLNNYTAPRAILVAEDNGSEADDISVVDNLVDTAPREEKEENHNHTNAQPNPTVEYDRMIRERDEMLLQMRHEMEAKESYHRDKLNQTAEKNRFLQESLYKMSAEMSEIQNQVITLREFKLTFNFN
jgi:huntingtin interacting protein 1